MLENQYVQKYLGEAVMVDEFRQKVNEKGFCKKHFNMLYQGQNKLGLSLETATRLSYIKKNFIESVQKPQKFIDNLNNCVICEHINENMERYYETCAQMYFAEPDFRLLLKEQKGFALEHFANLLLHAKRAGSMAKEYESELRKIESRYISLLLKDLEEYSDKFDYKNLKTDKPFNKNAVKNGINAFVCDTLKGQI